MAHTVTVEVSSASGDRVRWACTCGASRTAQDIGQAGAEAQGHLRNVEDGIV